jgi:hypothetical protein
MQAAKTLAGAHIEIPGIAAELQGKMTRMVEIRGEKHQMIAEKETIAVPMLCALIALEDERIDSVLRAFKVRLIDAKGNVVWPKEPYNNKAS